MKPADLDDLTRTEIAEFVGRLGSLPPVGGSIGYTLKD